MSAWGTVLATGLAWTLQATVLLGAAWLLTRTLANASAAARHLVWLGALAATLGAPLVSGVLPWEWSVPAPAWAVRDGSTTGARMGTVEAPGAAPAMEAGAGASAPTPAPSEGRAGSGVSGLADEARTPPVPTGSPATGAALRPFAMDVGPFLALVWLGGALLVLGWLLRGTLALGRARRAARPVGVPGWPERLGRLARAAGVEGPVEVLESDDVALPLTFGLRRPVVLLPAGVVDVWPRARLDAVLLHELAHIRRWDLAARVVARLVCAAQWFHPLAWAAARHLARESERACDDRVLGAGTRPSDYAGHLLEVVRGGRRGPLPDAAPSMARSRDFEGRLLALLDPATPRGPVGSRTGLLVAGTLAGLLVVVSIPAVGDGAPAGGDVAGAAMAGETSDRAPPAVEEVRAALQARDEERAGEATVVATLMELLDDEVPRVREASARALGDRRTAEAVPDLLRLLSDPEDEVREEAAVALGFIGDARSVEGLAERLREDADEDVRQAAAWALGETESREAVTRLTEALDAERGARLRRDIVEALGETGRPEAVHVLEARLRRADPRLQRTVLEALVEIGSDDAMAVLVGAMRSEDPGLRRMAARALSRGG